jgi:hypothetical protein
VRVRRRSPRHRLGARNPRLPRLLLVAATRADAIRPRAGGLRCRRGRGGGRRRRPRPRLGHGHGVTGPDLRDGRRSGFTAVGRAGGSRASDRPGFAPWGVPGHNAGGRPGASVARLAAAPRPGSASCGGRDGATDRGEPGALSGAACCPPRRCGRRPCAHALRRGRGGAGRTRRSPGGSRRQRSMAHTWRRLPLAAARLWARPGTLHMAQAASTALAPQAVRAAPRD